MFSELLKDIPNLRNICIRAGRSFDMTADELEQEGLLALWKTSEKGIRPINLYGFVSLSVRNACVDRTRTRYIGNHGFCCVEELRESLPAKEEYSVDWFFDVTEGVEEEKRRILFERYVLGLSEMEMAAVHKCARGTIKSRVSRACAKARSAHNAVV